jgi:hypothetical protein
MNYIFEMHKNMLSHDLILVYEGEFTQEITKSVLSMVERNMDSYGEDSAVKRKVFNVMVESLQNITKHSDDDDSTDDKKHSAIFMIGKQPENYNIISGNPIKNERVAGLKKKLEEINSLDKEGLKELYKNIIKNSELSDKGGAGLGFVDIARKSGKRLEYDFFEITPGFSFFCLKTSIDRI